MNTPSCILLYVYIPLGKNLSYESKKNTKALFKNEWLNFLIQFYFYKANIRFRRFANMYVHFIHDGKFTFIVSFMWKLLRVVIFGCTFSSACTEKTKQFVKKNWNCYKKFHEFFFKSDRTFFGPKKTLFGQLESQKFKYWCWKVVFIVST